MINVIASDVGRQNKGADDDGLAIGGCVGFLVLVITNCSATFM